MELKPTALKDVLLLTPKLFKDDRGYFFESYNQDTFAKLGIHTLFVQDNQSFSLKNTLRGLHFQNSPKAQAKLIQVIDGEIFDVAVDIRPNSPTYGEWVSEYLSSKTHNMLYIPEGFAHGFLVLSDTATVTYKCSDTYSPAHEGSIIWNDPKLNINWPLTSQPLLSAKDMTALPLS